MEMDKTAIDYADFAEYDRRQRRIEHHVLAAFLGGLVVGLVGMLLSSLGSSWLERIYDPYAYLALVLAVGATASGLWWALLSTFLAAVSMLVAAMGAGTLRGESTLDVIGGSAVGLNWILVLLVGLGLLAYVTRRRDHWGDLAAGVVGGVLIADVVGRAMPGYVETKEGFWPGPALLVGGLSLVVVLLLRRTAGSRMRALAVTASLAALSVIALAESFGAWLPLVP
jgi:hypothetical protein